MSSIRLTIATSFERGTPTSSRIVTGARRERADVDDAIHDVTLCSVDRAPRACELRAELSTSLSPQQRRLDDRTHLETKPLRRVSAHIEHAGLEGAARSQAEDQFAVRRGGAGVVPARACVDAHL